MCCLDVMKECETSIEAGGMAATTKLGSRHQFQFHQIVLEALGNYLFQQFGHGFQQGDGAVGFQQCVVRFVRFGNDNHDCGLPCVRVVAKRDAGVEDGGEGIFYVGPTLFE